MRALRNFNPRSREGSDFNHNPSGGIVVISILAPARGATIDELFHSIGIDHFNPRSREGSDVTVRTSPNSSSLFQSSLPRGERRKNACNCGTEKFYFNPRSREGSDRSLRVAATPSRHFNPRSREGSDAIVRDIDNLTQEISILAPARGATQTR